jgi:predicted transcriptional regulator
VQREFERKKQHGGFIELKVADQSAEVKAAAARAEYREQLRINRRRINDKLKSRPSLIERFEQDSTKKTAGSDALKKVATAVMGAGDDRDYDLFDEEERMKLKYDSDE